VEERDGGLAEERFDNLLDSTLSSSPELLGKTLIVTIVGEPKTERSSSRSVRLKTRSNPNLFTGSHLSNQSRWSKKQEFLVFRETLEQGDVKDRPKQTMFRQQKAFGELITRSMRGTLVHQIRLGRTNKSTRSVSRLEGGSGEAKHSTLASTSPADHSQHLARVFMEMHNSNLSRSLRQFED
jgi:hypothetical protein